MTRVFSVVHRSRSVDFIRLMMQSKGFGESLTPAQLSEMNRDLEASDSYDVVFQSLNDAEALQAYLDFDMGIVGEDGPSAERTYSEAVLGNSNMLDIAKYLVSSELGKNIEEGLINEEVCRLYFVKHR